MIVERRTSGNEQLLGFAATAPHEAANSIGELAQAATVLPPTATCEDLDRVFGRNGDLTSVLVAQPSGTGPVGLVQRRRFDAMMSGPYGYGRALHGRRGAGDVAQWDALVLAPATRLTDAAGRAIARPRHRVDDDVIVAGATRPATVPMPTLLAALARALAGKALTDPLTGLANREMFFGHVEEATRRSATEADHATAVIFLDLDGFKAVNDTRGHTHGDALLQRIAAALASIVRPTDLVARLGGDEFAVALECADGSQDVVTTAAGLALRMRDAVRAAGAAEGTAVQVRASIGVAVCRSGAVSVADLVHAADQAMYTAKRTGGDRIVGPVAAAAAGA